MSNISIPKFARVLNRGAEVFEDRDTNPRVKRMYVDVVQPSATTFRAAYSAELVAESVTNAARIEAASAVKELDTEFRVVRSILAGRFPGMVLPARSRSSRRTRTPRAPCRCSSTPSKRIARSPGRRDPRGTVRHPGAELHREDRGVGGGTVGVVDGGHQPHDRPDKAYTAHLLFKDAVRQAHGTHSSLYGRLRLRGKATITAPIAPPILRASCRAPRPPRRAHQRRSRSLRDSA